MIKMTFETEGGKKFQYELPEDDSMILAIELDAILREHSMIEDDETLEILDSTQSKILDY
jgi:hypothetical protein